MSVYDIGKVYHSCQPLSSPCYTDAMTRWKPNAKERLVRAALSLFRSQGFAQTTVAEIAERAGLTERTFFRYFADKREVLFAGAEEFEQHFITALDAVPGQS